MALTLSDVALDMREPGGRMVTLIDLPGTLTIQAGDCVGIAGASGSGKTTLLHLIAGIITPTRGEVTVANQSLHALSAAERDRWRARTIGLVFQEFHLIPELGLAANVLLPLSFRCWSTPSPMTLRAEQLLAELGLPNDQRLAASLSRGEQQRLAIARALLTSPPLLIADEPTASLDADTSTHVTTLLLDRARATGATLIMASHDPAVLARLDRVITLNHVHSAAQASLGAQPSFSASP